MSRHVSLAARLAAAAAIAVLTLAPRDSALAPHAAEAQGGTPPVMVAQIPMEAQNLRYMDIMDIDQANHRLYTGDAWTGGPDIFDVSTPNAQYLTTDFVRGAGAGTRWAPDLQKVFIGMSDGTVAVIDTDPASPNVGKIIDRVDTGGHDGADELDYDPLHHKVFAAHRREGFVADIDAINDVLVGTISGLHGILEQPRFNPADGMIYEVNPADNVVYEYDPNADTLVNTIDIGTPCGPMGLAINGTTNVAFLACGGRSNPTAVYLDLKSDTVIGQTPTTGGGDSAIYDPVANDFFFGSRGASGVNQMNVYAGGTPSSPIPQLVASPQVADAAGGVAYDETNKIIYVAGIQNGIPVLLGVPLPQ